MDGTILIAEDDTGVRKVLSQALTRAGCRVHATSLLATLARWVSEGKGDLVITDVAMPDGDGIEQIRQLRKARPELPIIVISAQNTIATALKAEESAAFAYLPKPFDVPSLLNQVKLALNRRPRPSSSKPAPETEDKLPLVGRTPVMQSLYRTLAKVIKTDLSVHLVGETGSGKSLIAKVIHELSDRRGSALITVGPDELQGPGHLAALFERSKRGTIVFDEVGEFGPDAQRALVRGLDESDESMPRVISTTQNCLDGSEDALKFRPDLYFRLCGTLVPVPPLRKRIDDIPLLVEQFLPTTGHCNGKSMSDGAVGVLRSCRWPGNLRQLRTVVKQAVVSSQGPEITEAEVRELMNAQPGYNELNPSDGDKIFGSQVEDQIWSYFNFFGDQLPPPGIYLRVLREIERPLIEAALEAAAGSKVKCAELLGINRNTLRKKIKDLDVSVKPGRKLS